MPEETPGHDRVRVTFISKHAGYNSGETAGFNPKRAAELIKLKYAVPFGQRSIVSKAGGEDAAGEDEAPAAPKKKKKTRKKKTGRGK